MNLTQELRQFLEQFLLIPEEEMSVLMSYAQFRLLKKREMLIECGQTKQRIWFIRNGYVRFYYFDEGMNEVTSDFVFAPGFVTAFRSFIRQEPSMVAVQAMENIETISWCQKDLYDLYDRFPRIERIGRIMAEQVFLSLDKHLTAFLNQSPQERYLWLLKEYPQFIRSIPLVYLASWLGITPETLSRIRRRTML